MSVFSSCFFFVLIFFCNCESASAFFMDSRLSLRASRISSAFHLRIGLPYRSDIRNARLIDKVIIRRLDAARIFYAAPTSISIDQSLLPGPLVPLRWARPFLLWLLFYSLVVNMRKFLPEKPQSHILRIIVAAVDVIQRILSLIAKLDFAGAGKVIRGCMRSITNSAGLQASERFDLSDWNVCKLRGKEQLSVVYTRYRFDVPSVPNGVLEADVGQEIQICSADARGKTLKGSFFPLAARGDRGQFNVVCRSSEFLLNEKLQMAMQYMSEGDELAFKGGKRRLLYTGKDEIISSMTLIASGLGITPTLQILSAVLPDEDATVEDIEVLWINESSEDFILVEDVEELEAAHEEKLFVTRVLDTDANNLETQINPKLRRAIIPYETGRIAVIMAPEVLAAKSQLLLEEMGYPADNILIISCP